MVRQEGNVGGYAYSVGYRWDLADHLTGITDPDGREISYGRNGVGQIGSVQSSDGIPAVTLAGTISPRALRRAERVAVLEPADRERGA
ncbi:MAG: RHS repeat protein [Gammaproteobacteria bacterium]|nr:RHS repeat protein [Gammaproteobacteria bacterium]